MASIYCEAMTGAAAAADNAAAAAACKLNVPQNQQEIRSMEGVSAQCMLFQLPLSKQEFPIYGDFC